MEDENEVLDIVSEGTPAQDSVKTKSVSIADIIKKMQGMDHDAINKFGEMIAQIGHEADPLPAAANAEANKASIAAMKEDLAVIFGKDNKDVSAEFLDEVTTLFEAAVNLRVAVEREVIFEEQAEILEAEIAKAVETLKEEVEAYKTELSEAADAYMDSVAEKWLEENQLAVESSIRLNQMESFFDGLRGLYEDHNIDIPEEEAEIVEGLISEIDDLKDQLNEALNQNLEMERILEDARIEQIFDEISEGLAATQKEKLRTLVEGLDYSDTDDFSKKVKLVKEANFNAKAPQAKARDLNEEVVTEVAAEKSTTKHYAAAFKIKK